MFFFHGPHGNGVGCGGCGRWGRTSGFRKHQVSLNLLHVLDLHRVLGLLSCFYLLWNWITWKSWCITKEALWQRCQHKRNKVSQKLPRKVGVLLDFLHHTPWCWRMSDRTILPVSDYLLMIFWIITHILPSHLSIIFSTRLLAASGTLKQKSVSVFWWISSLSHQPI